MSHPSATEIAAIVRISVVYQSRRSDLVLPAQLPLVEALPSIARALGVLDPAVLHGGYRLTRADGSTLDPCSGASAQGITQGEILTLVLGELISAPKQYDDLVEAVIDATTATHPPWQAADTARTASAISLTLIALSAILLALQTRSSLAPAAIAVTGSLVLLALGATLTRLGQHASGIAFGLAAAAYSALSGYLFTPPQQNFWGYPLATAGGAAIVAGAAAMLIYKRPVEILALPIAFGAIIMLPGTFVGITGIDPAGPYAIMLAAAATLAGALPWLTLSSNRVQVISPATDSEIFAPPPLIDGEKVAARINAGHRLLVAIRSACALTMLIAGAIVAAKNWSGIILTIIAGATLMFQSRQSARRASVLVLLLGGTALMTLGGLISIFNHPAQATLLLSLLLSATIIVTALTLLSDRARMRLTHLGDGIEIMLLVLLLPCSIIAAGIA